MRNDQLYECLHIVKSFNLNPTTLLTALQVARGISDEGLGDRFATLGLALRIDSIQKLIAMSVARGLEALEREQAEKVVPNGE